VAHRVGDRDVQRVALDGEVEGVPADVARGLEPRGEGELPGLARVGAGQQAVLDLGGQRELDRALAPREQVGEAAVGDDDVGERVRGHRDVGEGVRAGRLREGQLEHADRLPAVRHRRVQLRAHDLDALGGERAALGRAGERHLLGGLAALRAHPGLVAVMVEADQRLAGEVRDQEGDLGRADRRGEARADHLGGVDGRRILDGGQQFVEVESRHLPPT
jgi:hypothetical protein